MQRLPYDEARDKYDAALEECLDMQYKWVGSDTDYTKAREALFARHLADTGWTGDEIEAKIEQAVDKKLGLR